MLLKKYKGPEKNSAYKQIVEQEFYASFNYTAR